jgi:predicted nuclease of predicted toxin-antitoxin system
VLSIAVEKQALLITEDKDFGELVFRLKLPHTGVLLVRIEEANHKFSSVIASIKEPYKDLINKFSVINDNKIRIKE